MLRIVANVSNFVVSGLYKGHIVANVSEAMSYGLCEIWII